MRYNFIYYDKLIDFTQKEKVSLHSFFPNINLTNVYKLGPATSDFSYNYTIDADLPEVCQKYGCDIQEVAYAEIITDATGRKTLEEIPLSFCYDPKFTCFKYKILSLNYNCIGWSLGIRDWINPRFDDGISINKKEIVQFLHEVSTKYPDNHHKTILPIASKLVISADSCPYQKTQDSENNYDVAFYFKNDSLEHGSRYIDLLDNGVKVKSWTSKLGDWLLISHNLEYLDDYSEKAIYGISECRAVIGLGNFITYEEL